MSTDNNPKLLVALDFDAAEPAVALAQQLSPAECRLKVGKELFVSAGPELIKTLHTLGFDVFLDLKFHDIPNTVAKAVRAAAELGVWMVNVHASGGTAMLKAAHDAIADLPKRPLLIAVTVLTSMSDADLQQIGIANTAAEQVLHLATLAKDAGLDGIVCSAQEAQQLKAALGDDFLLVTPGIRPAGSAANDQQRIVTPEQAIAWGSDYLVVGRPITQAKNPAEACSKIAVSIV